MAFQIRVKDSAEADKIAEEIKANYGDRIEISMLSAPIQRKRYFYKRPSWGIYNRFEEDLSNLRKKISSEDPTALIVNKRSVTRPPYDQRIIVGTRNPKFLGKFSSEVETLLHSYNLEFKLE